MTLKTVVALAAPALGLLLLIVILVTHDRSPVSTQRRHEREELEALVEEQRRSRPADPMVALGELRSGGQAALAGSPQGVASKVRAREDLLRHRDMAIPLMMAAIHDPKETALFKLELVGLLGDMQSLAGQTLLLNLLADRSVEERFRTAALAKLGEVPSELAFPILKKLLDEEPEFGARYLVVKAIGASRDPQSSALLLEVVRNDKGASSRIQALDSLRLHVGERGVLDAAREVLFRDPEENIRLAAIGLLGRAPDGSVDPLLRQIAESPEMSGTLRKAAQSWLERRRTK